jgi:aldehyde dehydrogenase (NAD+)|tara:strand:+ start:502 stop:2037 length:1536 start_codon:yes stop_codon:yes gene_type:complete
MQVQVDVEAGVDELGRMREDLRAAHLSGITQTYEWRLGQLKALESLLVQNSTAIQDAVHADLGKSPIEVTCSEITPCLNECRYAMKQLRGWMKPRWRSSNFLNIVGMSTVRHVSRGTVLLMGVWNFPIQLTLLPLVGALAAGNCVVVKPHRYTDATMRLIARLLPRYLDERCVRVVTGTRVVTNNLLALRWDFVFFTGSPKVGKIIAEAQARFLTPMILELGGKSPVVVAEDADVALAARRICWGAFAVGSGQTCLRPDYLLVHESIADELLSAMVAVLMEFFGKDPRQWERSKWYARIVTDRVFTEKRALLERSKADATCRLVVGGDSNASTRYIAPTIFDWGDDVVGFEASALMEEEVFAPILPVLRFSRIEKALALINDRPAPLALYIFSRTTAVAERCITATRSGAVGVNDVLMHFLNHHLPFGGVGDSGFGSYHGEHSFDAFSHARAVLWKNSIVDVSFRYPPWESRPKRMLLAQSMDERSCGYIWGIFWGTLVLALGVIFLRFRV